MTVIPIRHGFTPSPASGEVNAAVVKELEELLAKAQAGEVSGLAYVTLHPGDYTLWHRVGRMTRGVIGALTLLQWDMCKADIEAD